MDVNGTRLHLILGREDWRFALGGQDLAAVCFDEARHTLGLRPRPFVFPTRSGATRLQPADRRGVAADRFGNIYWVGAGRRTVQVLGHGRSAPFTWWPGPGAGEPVADGAADFVVCRTPEPTVLELSGLTITTHEYLVVGVCRDEAASVVAAGLLVFDLAGGGPPVSVRWPDGLDVHPFDLTALPDGGIVVLDARDPDRDGHARLWQLDRNMELLSPEGTAGDAQSASAFAPVDRTAAASSASTASSARGISLAESTTAAAVDLGAIRAVALDALPDGSVVVLDRSGDDGHWDVSRWQCGERLPFGLRQTDSAVPLDPLLCADQRSRVEDVLSDARGHDLVVLPPEAGSSALARILVVDDRGDQAFELVADESGADLVTDYHPLRLFSGKGLVRGLDGAAYDLGDRWYSVPARQVRRYETSAVVELAPRLEPRGRAFDALSPATVWHRLLLDAAIPAGTSVQVESRAGDDLDALERQDWRAEPAPYLRGDGSEVPYHAYRSGGSWELLFQNAVGRYLQLRLTLRGDGRLSPQLWAARVHYPRFSYLREYVPDIYREDAESASFLDRYLANVEGMYTTLEGRITAVQRLVDPTTLDAEFLPWLASWVGAAVEPDWEPARVRLLVRYAAQMFRRRGTARGLAEAIRLAIHPCPTDRIFDADYTGDAFDIRIVEAFRTRSVPGVVFGDPNDLTGPRLSTPGPRWQLTDGGAALQMRWHDFMFARNGVAPTSFPVLTPTQGPDSRDWHDFVSSQLAPAYADVGTTDDLDVFRTFLASRYRRVDDYRAAWAVPPSVTLTDFADVGFPGALPADGAPLQDWLMFVSSVLPVRRSAHRAVVLVPIRVDDSDEIRAARLGRVRRVVEVERPAHTMVDVQPFWAAFRVGEARVGLETIIGEGSRYVDLVLGTGRLAYSDVPGGESWRIEDRVVVGRDRIEEPVPAPARTGGMR